jgi:3-deoxy-manno-octulosonate cytidylyltransferase (CMP-KDO synthetase)
MTVLGVIPARMASTRFPGKPLARIAGRPMIWHVYRRAAACRSIGRVLVATDDSRIARACRALYLPVMMTSRRCRSGTDRVAEVARRVRAGVYVNVQGDEPAISPRSLSLLVKTALSPSAPDVATLARPVTGRPGEPNLVKVVTDREGFALYFSRSLVPFHRGRSDGGGTCLVHIGVYAYRRRVLLEFPRLRPTPLEKAEKLEQLRLLENGYRILVAPCTDETVGVDTKRDLGRAEALLRRKGYIL